MSEAPSPPGRILILGGGTAGWMSAVSLASAWQAHPVKIQLMESADIGIIGVGEGSTPKMRRYFEGLGIPESEWMPASNATYKCGIRFPLWSSRKGYRSYYHPFFSLSHAISNDTEQPKSGIGGCRRCRTKASHTNRMREESNSARSCGISFFLLLWVRAAEFESARLEFVKGAANSGTLRCDSMSTSELLL